MKNIPIFSSYIDKNANEIVSQVLNSTFLSEGQKVVDFEQKLENYGINNCLAVNSGTSALHLALILAGVNRGDEVILPSQTFVASALAVLYIGAKPVFADINYFDGNININSIKQKITSKTKVIMPVHWGGYPCDMTKINKLAKENDLKVVEDAAHALGAKYKNKMIGSISDFTCFSFQAIKHLTTADGGLISTKLKKDCNHGKKLRWFGIDRSKSRPSILGERQFNLDEIGYKYHMNDYSAALGIANFTTLEKRLARRRAIAQKYIDAFSNFDGIKLFEFNKNRSSSYWLFGFHVQKRLKFIKTLLASGITTSVIHQRIDRYAIFNGLTKGLTNQEKFDKSQINIPIHDLLSDDQVDYIIQTIKKGW